MRCQTIALAVGIGLDNEDFESMTTAFGFAQQEASLNFIAIVDVDGEMVAYYPDPLAPELLDEIKRIRPEESVINTDSMIYSSLIQVQGVPFGHVILAQSLEQLHSKIKEDRNQAVIFCFFVLLCGAAITYLMTRQLTHPLETVVDTVEKVRQGDLSQRSTIHSQDEVGKLAQSFNMMVDALESTQRDLRQMNQTLEQRVQERTAALEQVEVSIQDTGSGIPADVQPRIFDPFFTTKEVGKGTGQGLAISHTIIVEQHEGELLFETTAGQGTTFIIRIPIDQDEPSG